MGEAALRGPASSDRPVRIAVLAAGALAAALLLVVGINSTRWIGATFPGFFLMPNRVVPSVALAEWSDGRASRFFQHQVIAVDREPVLTAAAVYEHVRSRPPGTRFRYTFQSADGHRFSTRIRSRVFSGTD